MKALRFFDVARFFCESEAPKTKAPATGAGAENRI
jgi:hypothetical protein